MSIGFTQSKKTKWSIACPRYKKSPAELTGSTYNHVYMVIVSFSVLVVLPITEIITAIYMNYVALHQLKRAIHHQKLDRHSYQNARTDLGKLIEQILLGHYAAYQ